MRPLPMHEVDQRALRTVVTFLEDRLGERGTVEWAIGLGKHHEIERLAVLQLLDAQGGTQARRAMEISLEADRGELEYTGHSAQRRLPRVSCSTATSRGGSLRGID